MLKYNGGDRVRKGTYWNFSNGERIDIQEEGILPGEGKVSYYRMPAAGIIVAGPVLGLLYAAFLPFIGIAMVVKLVAQKLGGGMVETVRQSAAFGWRPSESYLAGRKKKEQKEEEKEKKDVDEGGGSE